MVLFREMQIKDYDAVISLWQQTESMSLRDCDSRESISAYLSRNPGLSYVALDQVIVEGESLEGKLIGAVLVGTDGRRGYLQHLAVSSRYRGQKIGYQLVDKSITALAAIGIPKTHLFVYQSNLKAQAFYEKLGWFPRDEVRMFSFNASNNENV